MRRAAKPLYTRCAGGGKRVATENGVRGKDVRAACSPGEDAQRVHQACLCVHADRVVLGLRQFLLRGLDKVRSEWLRACTAFNLRKLMMAIEKLRAGGSLEPV